MSKEKELWLYKNAKLYESISDLLNAFNLEFKENKTYIAMRNKLFKLGIKEYRQNSIKNVIKHANELKNQGKENIDWIVENAKTLTFKELAKKYEETFGEKITMQAIYTRFLKAKNTFRKKICYEDGKVNQWKDKTNVVKFNNKWYSIPKSIYENSLIVSNCALAYITQVQLERKILFKNRRLKNYEINR